MADVPEEKSFFKKTKVLYTLLIVVLVMGALIALALTGRVEVSSEQIIGFGEWALGLLIGGHSAQRGVGYIAQALGRRALPEPAPASVPEPEPEPEEEPEEDEKDEEDAK